MLQWFIPILVSKHLFTDSIRGFFHTRNNLTNYQKDNFARCLIFSAECHTSICLNLASWPSKRQEFASPLPLGHYMKIIASKALKMKNALLFQLNTASGGPGGHLGHVQLLTRRGLLIDYGYALSQSHRLNALPSQRLNQVHLAVVPFSTLPFYIPS